VFYTLAASKRKPAQFLDLLRNDHVRFCPLVFDQKMVQDCELPQIFEPQGVLEKHNGDPCHASGDGDIGNVGGTIEY
jgi:hypothetical protein